MPYIGLCHFTALRTSGTCFTTSASTRLAMAACHGSMLAMEACTPAPPSDMGSDAGLRAFRGKPFPALGELEVFAFAAD